MFPALLPALALGLGLVAGIVTTIAGQGGGVFLLLSVSALMGPRAALAITAPALLLGNTHRAFTLRRSIDRAVAPRMILGGLPGSMLGGLAAGVLPVWVLRVVLVVLAVVAIAKALGWLRLTVTEKALVPVAFLLGIFTGTAGGAGVLVAPVLLSLGLSGRAFVGTSAAIAIAMHFGRIVSYAELGFFSHQLVGFTGMLTLAIFVGNCVGGWIAARLTGRAQQFLEYGTLVVCVALSVAGFG